MQSTFTFNPIGILHSCFTEKFGIPRQPRLVPSARAVLEILSPYDQDEAFNDLGAFSHLWLIFIFHGIEKGSWRPTVRPPRLGGNRRTGVFATRSGFRPNPIGMSAVVLEGINRQRGKLRLELSGIDLLDQTPILDVKPYVPYTDSISDAVGGFAVDPPQTSLSVEFTGTARRACRELENGYPAFTKLVTQVLGADPRPAYLKEKGERVNFGFRLYDVNIRWSVRGDTITVQSMERLSISTSNIEHRTSNVE